MENMALQNAIAGIGLTIIENRSRANVEEEMREDGMPYCKKCNEPLLLKLEFAESMAERLGKTRYVPRNCACMRVMLAEESAQYEAQKRREEVERGSEIASYSYREQTFSKDDGRAPKIKRMCLKYVEKSAEMADGNFGLAFVGENESGKTFWASCLANALMEKGETVMMIPLKQLIDRMNKNFGEYREETLRKIRSVGFLILDDYGAERETDFSLENAFEIIDARYCAKKPMIITTNLTEDALRNPSDIKLKRSYSRIVEMCPAIVKVEGFERRKEIAEAKKKALAEFLRG